MRSSNIAVWALWRVVIELGVVSLGCVPPILPNLIWLCCDRLAFDVAWESMIVVGAGLFWA